MERRTLRIGQVAAQAGVHIETLRYSERRGLLEEPARRPSGYREYAPDAVRVVRFVKRAQALGFKLREVQELLRLREADGAACAEMKARAEAKLAEIERKLLDLRKMKRALEVLVASCEQEGVPLACPILDVLEHDGRGRKEAKR